MQILNGLKEFGKFSKASLTELIHEDISYKFNEKGYCLDDSHCHYILPKNSEELESLVSHMTSKLGRSAITHWGPNVREVLRYHNLIGLLTDLPSSSKKFKVYNKGPVSIIEYKGRSIEVYPSQEIRTASHLHITAEGCEEEIPEGLDPRKTVEIIHQNKGLALVEHPKTKTHPLWQYLRTTKEDDELTKEVFEMADAAEVFNSYNTLWMIFSNVDAGTFVDDFNKTSKNKIAKVAGSDNHFGLHDAPSQYFFFRNLGRTGIYLPNYQDSKKLTGEEIIQRKKEFLKAGKIELLKNYTPPITFFMTMVPPIIARKLGLHNDSIS